MSTITDRSAGHGGSTSTQVRDLAVGFLRSLSASQRAELARPGGDPDATRWTYLPRQRPGLRWDGLDRVSRKALMGMLATVLSERAFAQALGVMAWEDVLDLREGGRSDRHCTDYWTAFYGDPGDDLWRWRTEGHHVSVTVTLRGDECVPSPLFLGLSPARVDAPGGRSLSMLCWEEELGRALVHAPGAARAIVDDVAPGDLLSEDRTTIALPIGDPGVTAADLDPAARVLLHDLVDLYLDRYSAPLRAELIPTQLPGRLSFAWAGGREPGEGHYYRIQGDGLLIEYCNTQERANHIHSVLRLADRERSLAP